MVKELDHAGYVLVRTREDKNPTTLSARLLLHDQIAFGITCTERVYREALDAPNRAIADQARDAMAEKSCESLNLSKVILGLRRRTA